MVDSLTWFIQGMLITNKKADTIIKAVNDSWCMSVGFPSIALYANNGGGFANIKLDELTSKLGLTVKFIPSYSPWSNGINDITGQNPGNNFHCTTYAVKMLISCA